MRRFVDGLRGIHVILPCETAGAKSEYNESVRRRGLRSEHPLVTVHAETGEHVLYVSPAFLKSIVGLTACAIIRKIALIWPPSAQPRHGPPGAARKNATDRRR